MSNTPEYNKAQRMTRNANTARKWQNAAEAWRAVDKGYGYFQDKIDYCLKMAETCKEFDKIFKVTS